MVEAELLKAVGTTRKGTTKFDLDKDPFRAIKVRDIFLPETSTFFAEIINCHKKDGSIVPTSIQLLNEVTYGELINKPVSVEFELIIDRKVLMNHQCGLHTSHKGISLETILKSCDNFYKNALKEETDKFLKNMHNSAQIANIYNQVIKYAEGGYLFRFGWGSGLISMTISEDLRATRKYGNSKNLINEQIPMGFVRLSKVS